MKIIESFEIGRKGSIELVVVFLVLDEASPTQEIEVIDVGVHNAVSHRCQQIHQFTNGRRDVVASQRQEEIDQHGSVLLNRDCRVDS